MADKEKGGDRQTSMVRKRYDRVAPVYELLTPRAVWFSNQWRQKVWEETSGKVLEVGIGTGKNIPYYPDNIEITAVDLSEKMLQKAKQRAQKTNKDIKMHIMDVTNMDFPDSFFDTAVATFVFSSVPDPVAGLREVNRVLRPGARLVMLEYSQPRRQMQIYLRRFTDFVGSIIYGPFNKIRAEQLYMAGFENVREEKLRPRVAKLVIASKPGKEL